MKNFNNSNDQAYIHGVDFTAELEKNEFNQKADDQAYYQHILKQ